MNGLKRAFLLVLLGVVLLLPVIPATPQAVGTGQYASFVVRGASAATQGPSTKSFAVAITSNGFNNGTLDIVVNQGDTVRITFTMDQDQRNDTSSDNHHIITIGGYSVKTTDINPSNPSSTVTFVADKLGVFRIICATPECPIHYLMLTGTLRVEAPADTTGTTSSLTSVASSSSTSVSTVTAGSQTNAATAASQTTSTSSGVTKQSVSSTSATADGSTGKAGVPFSMALATAVMTLLVGLIAGTIVRPLPRPS